jgi:predicted alpha/beta-hydrolase family hydrolase
MAATRSRLVDAGHIVMTFDYAYTHAGRKAPDRLPKLLDVHEAAARALEDRAGCVLLVGKSMGGRVGSHLVAADRCAALGLVYLGYPLVAVGQSAPRNTDHLVSITVPQLFISGTRDRMGPTEAIESVARSIRRGSVMFIEDGDHSLTPPKRSGRTLDDSLDTAVSEIGAWMEREL